MISEGVHARGWGIIGCLGPADVLGSGPMFAALQARLRDEGVLVSAILSPPLSWPEAPASYRNEMGTNITHSIMILRSAYSEQQLISLKHFCMDLESEFANRGNRTFNLNPGLVSRAGLVLASHKDALLRRFLGRGVWVEQQHTYRDRQLQPLSNAFSEYRVKARLTVLSELAWAMDCAGRAHPLEGSPRFRGLARAGADGSGSLAAHRGIQQTVPKAVLHA